MKKRNSPKYLGKTLGQEFKPREYKGMLYVTSQDIIEHYGRKWFRNWAEHFGIGHTGMMIPPNDKSHGKPEPQYGIYWHDFLMYKNIIEGGPTDFEL